MKNLIISASALVGLAGCTTYAGPVAIAPHSGSATASLRDAVGAARGTATATQQSGGIRLQVAAIYMSPGAYGAHIHTIGRCDPPGFEGAGGHWNPTSHQHGKENPQGVHKGDLPNLIVGADGRGTLEINIPGVTLTGAGPRLLDEDGAAIVIHAAADDYRTDPSGNSGARIACGVFG